MFHNPPKIKNCSFYIFLLVYCTISHNLFNFNRHSIAATGTPKSGYDAFCNVEMGDSLSDYFDMHGGADRNDGTDVAGEYCYIYNNSFLGEKKPYNVRGRPLKERTFEYNIVYSPRELFGTQLTHYKGQRLDNIHVGKNIWDAGKGKGLVLQD